MRDYDNTIKLYPKKNYISSCERGMTKMAQGFRLIELFKQYNNAFQNCNLLAITFARHVCEVTMKFCTVVVEQWYQS
jgi:hypothetical protein